MMKVYIVTADDYPEAAFDDEREAVAYARKKGSGKTARLNIRTLNSLKRVNYSVHEFALREKEKG